LPWGGQSGRMTPPPILSGPLLRSTFFFVTYLNGVKDELLHKHVSWLWLLLSTKYRIMKRRKQLQEVIPPAFRCGCH